MLDIHSGFTKFRYFVSFPILSPILQNIHRFPINNSHDVHKNLHVDL